MTTGTRPQIERQILPIAHTPLYNWHKYWARKTWNVIGEFVKNYCPPSGVILDPFAGSGVTGIEAVRHGRRAILADLTPIMEEVVWATLVDVEPSAIEAAFHRIEKAVGPEIQSLYMTICPVCGTPQQSWANVWEDGHLTRLRYVCQNANCETRHEKGVPATTADLATYEAAKAQVGKYWYPANKMEYPDGQPFIKREKYTSLDELFTGRNLYAFSLLMNAIEAEPNTRLRRLLKVAFTSIVHLGSRMVPALDPGAGNHQTPFSSTWTQQSYWFAPRGFEMNVWRLFRSSVVGHQGLVRAKEESASVFAKPVRFGKNPAAVFSGEADIYLHTGNSADLMKKLPIGSVDYVFTDPPYDASIQYGELSFLWVAWLRKDAGYVERIAQDEVVRNDRQHKSADVYQALLRNSFQRVFDTLKDDTYMTVTFHNPSFGVRNATIQAGVYAGFSFEKIHYQPTAVRSANSLMQPFGSAQGDFYLRFHKLPHAIIGATPTTRDDARFERVVVDTTTAILAERGEPTSYTFIINKIDPELAKRGFFSSLSTGLDVKSVLKNHLGKEFQLVPATTAGGASGELWWFLDPALVSHPEIPLSERVEATVLRQLRAKGNVEFTDVWEAVNVEFPNSMTPDTTTILDALKDNARPAPGGNGRWLLKPEVSQRETQHNEVLAALADIGADWGYQVWIGKKEQSASVGGPAGAKRKLADLVTADLAQFKSDIADLKTAQQLDCVWTSSESVVAAFEVESTTSMTSGLMRGSNLLGKVRRYIVIPEEREGQLAAKMKSPLFQQRFDDDGWRVLHFDHILNEARRLRRLSGKWDQLEGALTPAVKGPKPKQMSMDLG